MKCNVIVFHKTSLGNVMKSYAEYGLSTARKSGAEACDGVTDGSTRYQASKATGNHPKRDDERGRGTTSAPNEGISGR